MYTDAHLHLHDCFRLSQSSNHLLKDSLVCSSSSDPKEFEYSQKIATNAPDSVFLSFGIHPQNPSATFLPFLEQLLADKKISAIGECGFDFFTAQYKATYAQQKYVWDAQVLLAITYQVPLVIHCRKALDLIFADTKRLKLIPSIVFHGWGGSVLEALSLRKRGVRAFFSLGKGLLRGDKTLIECAKKIPISQILSETDAPWMQLRGEQYSSPSDIIEVVSQIHKLRDIDFDEVVFSLKDTFRSVFVSHL